MLWIFPNLLFYLRQVSFLTLIKNLFWFYYFKTILTIFTFVFFFCPDNFHINFHIFFILFIQRDLNKNFFHLNWLLLFVHNILVFTLFFYLFFFFFFFFKNQTYLLINKGPSCLFEKINWKLRINFCKMAIKNICKFSQIRKLIKLR